ncbi:MAG TPA: sugar ABC transporter substrate-binding protein [Pseudonocardia sp.]|nr:sugar ABC transporter substrate-binding protein [Pseudonocardia sp.]
MALRTRTAGAAVAATVLTLATACGGSDAPAAGSSDWSLPAQDPTATITVVGIVDPVEEGMNDVIAAFEQEHPTITVDYQFVPFDDLNTVLDSRIPNKNGDPDVFWADMPRIPATAERGYAEDLTDVFGEFTDSFDPAPVEAVTWEDSIWALPIANSSQLLYYNADLLAQAGIAPPPADTANRITWEQLGEDAKAAVDAGAQYGMLFGQFDRYYQLQPLPMSLGGSAGATGERNLTPDITSPEWIRAFDWYGSIFAGGASPRGVPPEQTDPLFLSGAAAYTVQGPWLLPSLVDSGINWGVAPHPVFAGGEAVTPTGSWSLAMNPFSDAKEAAAIFMKWMAIDGGSGYTTHAPEPELPAHVDKEAYFAREVFQTPQGQQAAQILAYETANTAVNRVETVGYIEFEEILGRAFADIRNGTPAEEALRTAATELETAWAQYR